MGIMVIDSSSRGVSVWIRWVSCSLRVPAQSMVHPIIQNNTAIGRNSNLISRLRIWFFTYEVFWGRAFELCCLWLKLCEVVISIGRGLAACCTQAPTFFTPKESEIRWRCPYCANGDRAHRPRALLSFNLGRFFLSKAFTARLPSVFLLNGHIIIFIKIHDTFFG